MASTDLHPDRAAMLAHLEHLFGGYVEGAHDGLIEISWTETRPDASGRYRLVHARLFGMDALEEAADFAAETNATPMCNVYVGGALRHPDTAPFGRGNDADFLAASSYWCDLDSEDAARSAKANYADLKPTFLVLTGTHPHNRVQCWWRLSDPIMDPDRLRNALSGIAHRMGGDTTVTNPSRVMRLAGTIAWPQKAGRVPELTRVVPLREPGLAAYMPEHIERVFPPVHSLAAHRERRQADGGEGTVTRETSALGLPGGKVVDGRERYMRNVILANLVEFVGSNGCEPTSEDLFDAAWPTYSRQVSFDRPGRGEAEFREKCQYTARRFAEGRIHGLKTIEATVEAFRRKTQAREAFGPEAEAEVDEFGAAAAAATIRIVSMAEFLTRPDPTWLVDDLILDQSTGFFFGHSGCGKSFLILDLCLHIAYGHKDWHGRSINRATRALYCVLEGHSGFKWRIQGWMQHHGVQPTENFDLVEDDLNLMDPADQRALVAAIDGRAKRYDLIIIDTASQAMAGADENAAEEMSVFCKVMGGLAKRYGCAVAAVHHKPKSGEGLRGSGSLKGNVDWALEVSKEDRGASPITLKSFKLRDAPDDFEIRFRVEEAPVGMNLERTTLIIVGEDDQETRTEMEWPPKDICRAMLRVIDEAWGQGAPLSHASQTKRSVRYAQRILSRQFRLPPRLVEHMLVEWIDNAVLSVEVVDRNTKTKGLKVIGRID